LVYCCNGVVTPCATPAALQPPHNPALAVRNGGPPPRALRCAHQGRASVSRSQPPHPQRTPVHPCRVLQPAALLGQHRDLYVYVPSGPSTAAPSIAAPSSGPNRFFSRGHPQRFQLQRQEPQPSRRRTQEWLRGERQRCMSRRALYERERRWAQGIFGRPSGTFSTCPYPGEPLPGRQQQEPQPRSQQR